MIRLMEIEDSSALEKMDEAKEKMKNWKHHLKTLSDMLPYPATSGHNLYLKSANLEKKSKLEHAHSKGLSKVSMSLGEVTDFELVFPQT